MARDTKAQREGDWFRARITELLKDPDWLEEEVCHWLRKELQRERDYVYSEREHAALRRIMAASTLFEGWGGCSVLELLAAASRYVADCNEEDEMFIKKLQARPTNKLRLREMGQLVRLSRFAGVDVPRFKPALEL